MTANHDLDRRLAGYYASQPPLRAPDWVLQGALATIETTHQRRGLFAPWRYRNMTMYTKLAAAVAVIAIGALAVWWLAPPGPGGPPPGPSPTPSSSPTPTSSSRPGPSAYVPPALTQTFTSDLHGLSVSYPAGWTSQAATAPWTSGDPPFFGVPSGDFIYDPVRTDHLFISAASQPLGGTPLDSWLRDFLAAERCTMTDVVVDGAAGLIDAACGIAVVAAGGRGYFFLANVSNDDADLQAFDSAAWFEDVLATVQLQPEAAVDALPSASP